MTQVGSGLGNTANGHPVPPSQYHPFTPGGELQPNLSPFKDHGGQPNFSQEPPGQGGSSLLDPLKSARFWASNGTNGLKNFKRAQGTFGSAADRHYERYVEALNSGNVKTALRENALADQYRGLSNSLKDLTSRRPGLGYVPQGAQKFLSQSAFDHLNRPGAPGQPLLKNAIPALRDSKFGGDNAAELLRRGVTKVGGLVTLGIGAYDFYDSVVNKHDSMGHAAARTGSSIAISAAAGGLAQAGVAAGLTAMGASATVPVAGWAVAAGIGAGMVASYLNFKYHWSDKVADRAAAAGTFAGEKFGQGAHAVGGLFKGAEHVFGFN